MLENRINGNNGYKSGNWQVQNNKLGKKFERSSSEIKKIIARNILNILHFLKKFHLKKKLESLSILFKFILTSRSPAYHHLCSRLPHFLMGPVSLKQMA